MLFPIFVLGLVTKKTEITNTELALMVLAFELPASCAYPYICRQEGECMGKRQNRPPCE